MSWLAVLLLIIVLIVVASIAVGIFIYVLRHRGQPFASLTPAAGGSTATTCNIITDCPAGTAECRSIDNQPATCNTPATGTAGRPCNGPYGPNSCATGLICSSITSICLVTPGNPCTATPDCLPGLNCVNRVCTSPTPPPPPSGNTCTSDAQCPGQVCDTRNQRCIALGVACPAVGASCAGGLICGDTLVNGNTVLACLSPPGFFCRTYLDCAGAGTDCNLATQTCVNEDPPR